MTERLYGRMLAGRRRRPASPLDEQGESVGAVETKVDTPLLAETILGSTIEAGRYIDGTERDDIRGSGTAFRQV